MSKKNGRNSARLLPDAVLFDFDGVIADTEPLHWRAFCEALRSEGLAFSWRTYATRYLGFDDRGVFREHFKRRGRALSPLKLRRLMTAKADAFERLVLRGEIAPYPGVVRLIRSLKKNRVPVGLCTGALRRDIRPLLRRFKLTRGFDVVVTADDVRESKPNPRAYCLALRRLRDKARARSIAAQRCVAIEDTPAGIEAARGAGMKAVAVTNTYTASRLRGAAWVVDSLEKVSAQAIAARVLKPCGQQRSL
jgi:beta-phosphoglucomutase